MKCIFLCFLLGCVSLSSIAQKHLFSQRMVPFSLHEVRLTEGMFKHAMELDRQWLLRLDPDRLMNGFRTEAGLTPRAPKYGGWEGGGLAGQTFGHYLSACAMMYASTGDGQLKERMAYCVRQLDTCQQAMGNGLVAGFPRAKDLFAEVASGDIRTKGFDLNGGYVPLYNMHKLFAGLTDVYRYTEDPLAYKVIVRLGNFMYSVFNPLSDSQIQQVLLAEHGGFNESVAELYALTGDSKFLKLAERLNHRVITDPLSRRQDDLAGKHANTQIPKIVGVMREYELSKDTTYLGIADFFWNTVVHNHSYVIGGNSEAEHFGAPGRTYDRITDKTCETCNSYNMLKLTKHLFMDQPDVEKVDYYERTLYNQILASQNPRDGMVCYMSPLVSGARKGYSSPFDSFWCCVGTGLENHARYGEFIYCTDEADNLYVNLFIPSELQWKKRDIQWIQQARFPESDTVTYLVQTPKSQKFTVYLRYPHWAVQGCTLLINGKKIKMDKTHPGEYIPLTRKWKNGDKVQYVLPMSVSSEAALGDSTVRAYLYGPIVLASVLPDAENTFPVVVTDHLRQADRIVQVGTTPPVSFTMNAAWPHPYPMIPYYKAVDARTVVYFEHYTPSQWEEKKDQILLQRDKERWVQSQTVSQFQPGEMQPERDHAFTGERLELGELHGRKFRKAMDGGWFSFEMDVLPDQPMDLMCTYWGDLGDIYKFTVDVDEVPVSTVIIHWWGGQFMDKVYHIPAEVTRGKEKVKITFRALDGKSVAGPLFNCKILKH